MIAPPEAVVQVVIENIADHLTAKVRPGLEGRALFFCTRDGDRIRGRRGLSSDGFLMELTLSAVLRRERFADDWIREKDLDAIELTYTDDFLEFRGTDESDIPFLIESLREESNQASKGPSMIPGGEIIGFSAPMKKLILLGEKARPAVEAALRDPELRNEAALILGAIGDSSSIPQLIEAYPATPIGEDASPRKGEGWRVVCVTFALSYLAGQQIGRDRTGTEFGVDHKGLWTAWWKEHGKDFRPSDEKPNHTWVPAYPSFLYPEHARRWFLAHLKETPYR